MPDLYCRLCFEVCNRNISFVDNMNDCLLRRNPILKVKRFLKTLNILAKFYSQLAAAPKAHKRLLQVYLKNFTIQLMSEDLAGVSW